MNKTINLYLDGKYHLDVVSWALAANMTVNQAKVHLLVKYADLHPKCKTEEMRRR